MYPALRFGCKISKLLIYLQGKQFANTITLIVPTTSQTLTVHIIYPKIWHSTCAKSSTSLTVISEAGFAKKTNIFFKQIVSFDWEGGGGECFGREIGIIEWR